MNTYAYVENDPINLFDPFGLSPADVDRIHNNYNHQMDYLNSHGLRNINPYWNNISAGMNWVSGGLLGSDYLGCGQQETFMSFMLGQDGYDDEWTFTRQQNLVHRWGEARSSNPDDPVIMYDPWKDIIRISY